MHKCPAILEHPFYPPWFQLIILVLESFFVGMIVGKFLLKAGSKVENERTLQLLKEKTMDTDDFTFAYAENKAPVERNEKWVAKVENE